MDRGLKQISTQMEGAVKKKVQILLLKLVLIGFYFFKKYGIAERAIFLSKMISTVDYEPLKKADVVIEAVFEVYS